MSKLYAKILPDTYRELKSVIHQENTHKQQLLIAEIKGQGMSLILDNQLYATYVNQTPYHEALIHPYSPANHERILIIGSGSGCSVGQAVRRGWVNIIALDHDHRVIELSDKYLHPLNNHAYQNSKVNTVVEEGRNYLKNNSTPFSIIVLDILPDIINKDRLEWVQLIHDNLLPNGLLTYSDGDKYSQNILHDTVMDVFNSKIEYRVMNEDRFANVAKNPV